VTVTAPPAASPVEVPVDTASPEEAAAIVAAVESFVRATAAASARSRQAAAQLSGAAPDAWHRAAILEGVDREHGGYAHPWMRTP
jgi:hypothetical protein